MPIIYINNDDIRLNSSSSDKVVVNGSLGIGTTSPAQKLDVSGNAQVQGILYVTKSGENSRFNSADANGPYVSFRNNGTAKGYIGSGFHLWTSPNNIADNFGIRAESQLDFGIGASVKMTLDSSGNVGIGTTSPTQKLEIHGNVKIGDASADNYVQAVFSDGTETRMHGYGFYMSRTNSYIRPTSDGSQILVIGTENNTWNYVALDTNYFTVSTNASEHLRVTNIGNVGIGTTSPAFKLHILGTGGGDSTFTGGVLIDNNNATDGEPTLAFRVNSMVAGGNYWLTGLNQSNNYSIAYGPSLTDGNTLFKIQSNGNVGIGTTSPDSKFHVEDTNPEVRITGTGGTSFPRILWEYPVSATQASRWALTSSASGNTFYLYNYTQSKKIFQVDGTASHITLNHDAAGTTQIGTSTTQTAYQLYVATNVGQTGAIEASGSVKITSGALGVNIAASATAGRIDASNDIVAYSTSDKRLKENIKPIENALDKVKSLTGVEFDWIEETKHVHGYEGHDVGVIAQEVQEVLPEAIRTNDSGYLSVRYEKMIALLVEANKELAARVELLEQKLKQ